MIEIPKIISNSVCEWQIVWIGMCMKKVFVSSIANTQTDRCNFANRLVIKLCSVLSKMSLLSITLNFDLIQR